MAPIPARIPAVAEEKSADAANATKAAARLPQTADAKAHLKPTSPNGTTLATALLTNTHNGYPGGCGTPKVHAATANSPASPAVIVGAELWSNTAKVTIPSATVAGV